MDRPIRVLQVFAQMNRGGAETMIMNLYRNIDRTKVQFDFIVHTEEKCAFDNEIKSLGGRIFRIPVYKGKNHTTYVNSWKRFFREHPEYKIVHGHVRSTASIYLKIAKNNGLITIAHSHNTSSGKGFSAIVKNVLQYPIRYYADHLLACSKVAGEWLFGDKACKKRNFHILKNAIDTQKFVFNSEIRDGKRKELNIEDKFVIGHIGRFHSQKNHEFLIDIFKTVYEKNKDSVLILVGEGELKKAIEQKVNDLGLSTQVIFTGARSDIPELLQAMDIFVFPSLYEGLGIVTIEAQAAGIPCIVSNNIPNEALVTTLIEKEPLEFEINWVNKILHHSKKNNRVDTYKQIKSNGYDIEESSKWLENFYLKVSEQ